MKSVDVCMLPVRFSNEQVVEMNHYIDRCIKRTDIMNDRYPHWCFFCNNKIRYEEAWESYRIQNDLLFYKYFDLRYNLNCYSNYNKDDSFYNERRRIVHKLKIAKKVLKYKKQFKKLWRSNMIKFYCCKCYGKIQNDNMFYNRTIELWRKRELK